MEHEHGTGWGCEGGGRRGRAHRRSHRRKERVLHTRVSEHLAEDIRRIAEDLRVPASNLVRNVLEEVFDVVESVSDDVGELFGDLLDEADAARERLARSRSRRPRRSRERAWEAARAEVEEAERSEVPPPPAPPVDWHRVEEGRAAGPFSPEQMAEAAGDGSLAPDTFVWCAGMRDWRRAREVEALSALFEPPPLPPTEPAP